MLSSMSNMSNASSVASLTLENVLVTMGVTCVLGIVIAAIYMLVGPYRKNLVVTLAVLPMLVSMIIVTVNGNVGASVAVLGAFGLVRFRSAPGSAKDIAFIFYSMAIGLITGMGSLSMAAILTIFVGLILLLLIKSPFGNENTSERSLRITVPEDLNYMGAFEDLFHVYTSEYELISVKTTNMGTMYELRYNITLRNKESEKEFLDALRCRNGNLTIVLGLARNEKEVL